MPQSDRGLRRKRLVRPAIDASAVFQTNIDTEPKIEPHLDGNYVRMYLIHRWAKCMGEPKVDEPTKLIIVFFSIMTFKTGCGSESGS